MACAPAVLFGNSLDYTSVTCAQHTVASMLGLWLQLCFPCAAFFQGTKIISDLHTVFFLFFAINRLLHLGSSLAGVSCKLLKQQACCGCCLGYARIVAPRSSVLCRAVAASAVPGGG